MPHIDCVSLIQSRRHGDRKVRVPDALAWRDKHSLLPQLGNGVL